MKRISFLLVVVTTIFGYADSASGNLIRVSLTGIVHSDSEGPMEGVLVSAKRIDGTITVTVVSDHHGRYGFPASRMGPGTYRIEIRAVGYDAENPSMVVKIGKGKTEADIKLNTTQELDAQLSDAEWLMSIPGASEQKQYLYMTCSHCHTLGPILKSTYDTDGWSSTFARMSKWDQGSSISKPVSLPTGVTRAPFGNIEFAKYLSSINLGGRSTHNFELKKLPRPHGSDTKVIITEYDLPRSDAQPHDVVVGNDGAIWYDDFAEGIIGRLNPASGEVKEWEDPLKRPGYPGGFLDLEADRDGNLWAGRHDFASFAGFDKTTEKFVNWDIPVQYQNPRSATDMIAITSDQKVWTRDNFSQNVFKVDLQTGKLTMFDALPADMKGRPGHNIYGITLDSKGNMYEADIEGSYILKVDGATGKVTAYGLPTPNAGPRRMHMDSEDRLWIGEYYSKKIAVFDTRTARFQEWPVPIPWYGPYDVVPDKNGNVWTGTMTSDIILQLDTNTGKFRQYLLPRLGVNVRRVELDRSSKVPVFWVGENHQAKIAKVEPQD